MMSMQNEQRDDLLLARLRSGLLSAEEALALNEELEQEDVHAAGSVAIPSAVRTRLKAIQTEELQPLSRFEELCYKELEGELSPNEKQELDAACEAFPRYAQMRVSILQTRLVVPTNIVFPHKERLKHHEQQLFVPLLWKSVAAAACLFLFIVLGSNLFDYQAQTPIVAEMRVPEPVQVTIQQNTIPQQSVVTPSVATTEPALVLVEISPTTMPVVEQNQRQSVPLTEAQIPETTSLQPLTTLSAMAMLRSDSELLIASKAPDLSAFHDWETIMLEDEIAQFEEEMQELHENLPQPERPLAVKFIDFVITQLAQR